MPFHFDAHGNVDSGKGDSLSGCFARITRRSFLAICAAGCARIQTTDAPVDRPTSWALFSDTHIHESLERNVRGSHMADNLREAVAAASSESIDAALFNGDMAYRIGTTADYAAFMPLIAPLRRRNLPLHFTLGNHDDRYHFLETIHPSSTMLVKDRCCSRFIQDGRHWIFLDSLERTNSVRGQLGTRQCAWLAHALDAHPHVPAVLFLHHNPETTPVGLRVGLRDTAELLEIVLPRRQVKAVFFGHTHAFRAWAQADLQFVNLPAIGYRFLPGVPLGWLRAIFTNRGMSLRFHAVGSSRVPWPLEKYMPFRSG